MEIILFYLTLDCTIVIAFNLYVLEVTDAIDAETMAVFIDVFDTVLITFFYFYLSEWITADLLAIGDHFYDSPWYLLPVKQQRLLMLPICRAQRVFRFKGLGLFDCSLEVFSMVCLIQAA